ncbi:MAG TPA: hypothetical protein PLR25_22925 [Planctomycetaceae bacterium]|nr:hypothetical protein [Planctomycetaceae bacterium]
MLKARDFKHLEAYVLTLDKTPDVVTPSFLSPTKDFNDVELQDLAEITVPAHGVGFNLLSTQTGGVAVLTWVKTPENVGRALAESLHGLDIKDQPDALIRFAFSQTDNSHFSKSWWNRLSEAEKAGVRSLIAQDIHPFADPTSLVDTGLRLASFRVQRQERHWPTAGGGRRGHTP